MFKKLEQLVHLDKFKPLSGTQITSLWIKRFEDRESQMIPFTLDRRTFLKWSSRALGNGSGYREMPLFIHSSPNTNWIIEHQMIESTDSMSLSICKLDDYRSNQHNNSLWNVICYNNFLLDKGVSLFLIPKMAKDLCKIESLLLLKRVISSYINDEIFKKWIIGMNSGIEGEFNWIKYKEFIENYSELRSKIGIE